MQDTLKYRMQRTLKYKILELCYTEADFQHLFVYLTEQGKNIVQRMRKLPPLVNSTAYRLS